jgi:6-pyruvoyltetrahydropterin/6-carboxytetrahydropterin synthase
MIQATRYHDICAGHRVFGHESKCAHLHGHNYRFHFTVEGELDAVGRVMDFSVIKSHLAMWLEDNWDHKFLIWEKDDMAATLKQLDPVGVLLVPFNPTAENIAEFFVEEIAPIRLSGTGATLVELKIEETRKCAAIYKLER